MDISVLQDILGIGAMSKSKRKKKKKWFWCCLAFRWIDVYYFFLLTVLDI